MATIPFGTRLQDEIISLNDPDIIEIHGIYETSDVISDKMPILAHQK